MVTKDEKKQRAIRAIRMLDARATPICEIVLIARRDYVSISTVAEALDMSMPELVIACAEESQNTRNL